MKKKKKKWFTHFYNFTIFSGNIAMKNPSKNFSRYICFIPFSFFSSQNWPYIIVSINISPDFIISFFVGNLPWVFWKALAVEFFGLFTCWGNNSFDLSIVSLLFWFVCFFGSVLFGIYLGLFFWSGLFWTIYFGYYYYLYYI